MPRKALPLTFFVLVTIWGCRADFGAQPFSGPSVLPPERSSSPVVPLPILPPTDGGSSAPDGPNLIPTSGPSLDAGSETDPDNPQSASSRPDLSDIYDRTVKSAGGERNPLIVIPGVLGSRLVDQRSGLIVWGEFGGDGIDPSSPNGARLLALPMVEGKSLHELTDDVHVQGVLDALEIRVFGVPFGMNAYRDILVALGVGGYHESATGPNDTDFGGPSHNSFQFAYDWRRDNVENAQRLHQFLLGKKAEIEAARRRRSGDAAEPVRFDIVAHSMGGLLTRYYLQYGDADLPDDGSQPPLTWAGAKLVERVVLVGTPNAGSIDAVQNLVNGVVFSQALPRYESAILGTMPGLYQLLPRSRHRPVLNDGDRRPLDILNPATWTAYRWGLANPGQHRIVSQILPNVSDPSARLRIALDHQRKCLDRARAFHAALDVPAKPPHGTTVHLIAGDAYATSAQLWAHINGRMTISMKLPGDGKVTRASALMDERYTEGRKWSPRLVSPIGWSSVNFLFTDHLGLTRDPSFTDNVLYLLLEAPR